MTIAGRTVSPLWLAPIGLPLVAGMVVALWPDSALWSRQPWFLLLPYVLCAFAATLGGLFTQSRVFFVALVVALTLAQLDYAFFISRDVGRGEAVLLLGTLFIPCMAAVLYRLNERGLFTSFGLVRATAVLVVLGLMFTLSLNAEFQAFSRSVGGPTPLADKAWLGLPGLGLLALLASAPFLALRKKGESPMLGLVLLTAIVFVFAGFGFQGTIWQVERQRTVLLLFTSLGAVMLVGAVLETSWRHMNIDELTELPSRRPFRHQLRCLRDAYVLALVDLDHFKRVNDTYGHVAGDQVLRFVASELSRKAGGKVYRYGGEEFVVVYEKQTYEQALDDLDEVRESIGRKQFRLRRPDRPARKPRTAGMPLADPSSPSITLTVSVGAARPGPDCATPQEVLDAADQALYRAKEKGRNRVCHVT